MVSLCSILWYFSSCILSEILKTELIVNKWVIKCFSFFFLLASAAKSSHFFKPGLTEILHWYNLLWGKMNGSAAKAESYSKFLMISNFASSNLCFTCKSWKVYVTMVSANWKFGAFSYKIVWKISMFSVFMKTLQSFCRRKSRIVHFHE